MYYSTSQRKSVVYHRLTAIFFISISLVTFPVITFAEVFDKSVAEYRQKASEEQQKGNLEQALTDYSKALTLGCPVFAVTRCTGSRKQAEPATQGVPGHESILHFRRGMNPPATIKRPEGAESRLEPAA